MSQEYLELKRTLKKAGLSTKGNMATLAKRVKDSNIINVDDAIQAQPKTPSEGKSQGKSRNKKRENDATTTTKKKKTKNRQF